MGYTASRKRAQDLHGARTISGWSPWDAQNALQIVNRTSGASFGDLESPECICSLFRQKVCTPFILSGLIRAKFSRNQGRGTFKGIKNEVTTHG
jgi:hypothetical protein